MLPDFLILGAMKAGTTSLYHYLRLHPQVFMPRSKELNFFTEEGTWSRGVSWYRSQFRGQGRVCGEASPSYSAFPVFRGVPARIHALLPNAKLIYVLRDPVQRCLSHYVHAYAVGSEERSVDEALLEPRQRYLCRSLYALQLERYLEYFSASQILLLTQRELEQERQRTLRRVHSFLGVDPEFWHPGFERLHHRSAPKRRPFFVTWPWARNCLDRLPGRLRYWLLAQLPYPLSERIVRPQPLEATLERLNSIFGPDLQRLRTMIQTQDFPYKPELLF